MRKLLGYRLKEEKYYETASMIMYGNPSGSTVLKSVVKADSASHNRLQAAGVMHWFEEVYEEEKFTGWSISTGNDSNWLAYFIDGIYKYGFALNGMWIGPNEYSHKYEDCAPSGKRPATTEEIQQSLIKEATKRGFKEGVIIDNSGLNGVAWKQDGNPTNGGGFYFDIHSNKLILGQKWVFKDGKWAEILPNETLNGKTAIIDGVEYELKIKN